MTGAYNNAGCNVTWQCTSCGSTARARLGATCPRCRRDMVQQKPLAKRRRKPVKVRA